MKVGISTACLYPMETKLALQTLLEKGFRHFEIFFNTYREIQPDYVGYLKSLLDEYGASVKSIHPFTSGFEGMLLFSNYETRTQDGMEFYRQYFRAANQLGAELVVLHGQRLHSCCQGNRIGYFASFSQLVQLGKADGVTVVQENVNGFLSQNPDFVQTMRQELGEDASFVFDIKQAVRAGVDPYEMCRAMGDRIVHIHLNDNDDHRDCLVPWQGTMDYSHLFGHLFDQGFSQDIILEVYRTNFESLEELWQVKRKMEALLRDFGKIV